jgi:predicted enzyme related to lactoylglutathione lyase
MNLNQITVPSLDLSVSVPFYKKLGLKQIVDAMPAYARFECPDGNSTFSIHEVDILPAGEGIWVYFECDNLDEYIEQLEGKGIVFEQLPADQKWLWREARLKDPDGNQLILYFAGENRLNPPWRIEDSVAHSG